MIIGNNVLAHVPDINDFVKGLKLALKDEGVITMEFPHLKKLIEFNQFDTIYHEHFSYFSLVTVEKVFAAFGLVIFDVEEIPPHGGSLRIYARHDSDQGKPADTRPRRRTDRPLGGDPLAGRKPRLRSSATPCSKVAARAQSLV